MRAIHLAAALALIVTPGVPAFGAWRLVEQGKEVAVANGGLRVTPGEDWNRWTSRPIKRAEVWTLDGMTLNELYFVSSLESGETLLRDTAKKDRPLPVFPKEAKLSDIPHFYETTVRLVLQTSLFSVTEVKPATFGGRDAVRFAFEYSTPGSSLQFKGLAIGTIVQGRLHLISFTAPALHYYERDLVKVERIMASAKL